MWTIWRESCLNECAVLATEVGEQLPSLEGSHSVVEYRVTVNVSSCWSAAVIKGPGLSSLSSSRHPCPLAFVSALLRHSPALPFPTTTDY